MWLLYLSDNHMYSVAYQHYVLVECSLDAEMTRSLPSNSPNDQHDYRHPATSQMSFLRKSMVSRSIPENLAAQSRTNLALEILRGSPGYLTADASALFEVHVDAWRGGQNLSQDPNLS
jgi:hypothetical protein